MNIKTIYTVITVAPLFIATMVNAHDPSKHIATKEKPNCEAMHNTNSSMMDMKDPVMQAMMQQCSKPDIEGRHAKQNEKPACTEDHAKLGHCTLEADVSGAKDSKSADSEHDHD